MKAQNLEDEKNKLCPICKSLEIIRDGNRKTSCGLKQRWFCKSCKKRFTLDPIKRVKGNLEAIKMALDLYMKGVSYRGIQDSLKQHLGIVVNHVTVMRWVHTFMNIINEHVKDLHPKVGDTWLADEQVVFLKGKIRHVFNCLDNKTRFLLANKYSKTRTVASATALFKEAKRVANKSAKQVRTDGFMIYPKVVTKQFWTNQNRNPHYYYKSLKNPEGTNNRLERYHSSFRQRDKVMRGFKSISGVTRYAQNFKTYYNFVRKHSTLGMTPAQYAGINVESNWEDLLLKALRR